MSTNTTWKRWLATGAAVGTLAFAAVAFYPQTTQAVTDAGATSQVTAQLETLPSDFEGPRGWGKDGMNGAYAEQLAAELGITVEELQAAQEEAANAALDQAVADGWLTQAQADAIRARGAGFLPRIGIRPGANIDMQSLLAEALGISVEELQAAHETAQSAMIAQAVADGKITQEQADLMEARQAFRSYQSDIAQAQLEESIQEAVAAGAITQEQADLLLSAAEQGMWRGMERGFRFPGMAGFRGHGGMRGFHGMVPGK
ncbi:MAG: hypothetical protein H3C34_22465 [Caldilineaceae bacterium]|nr:hypothetical protein [Caldilineaceae bacterium]